MSKKDQLNDILKDLRVKEQIESYAVCTREGMPIIGQYLDEASEENVSGMAGTIYAAAETASMELSKGDVQNINISTSEGHVILRDIGQTGVLIVVLAKDTRISDVGPVIEKVAKGLISVMA